MRHGAAVASVAPPLLAGCFLRGVRCQEGSTVEPNPNPNLRPMPAAVVAELARLRALERGSLECCARC